MSCERKSREFEPYKGVVTVTSVPWKGSTRVFPGRIFGMSCQTERERERGERTCHEIECVCVCVLEHRLPRLAKIVGPLCQCRAFAAPLFGLLTWTQK